MAVRILNPQLHGSTHTSLKRAKMAVRNGLAVWVTDGSIRFNETHHRRIASTRNIDEERRQRGYDNINRRLSFNEMRHIPFVNVGALR